MSAAGGGVLVRKVSQTKRARVAPKRRSMYLGLRSNVPTLRVPRSLRNPETIYPFKRTTQLVVQLDTTNGFVSGATTGGGLGFGFTLTNLLFQINSVKLSTSVPQSAEFTNLFDQFRISMVDIKMVWSCNLVNASAAGLFAPQLLCVVDNDDYDSPLSNQEMFQRPDHWVVQMGANGNTNNVRHIRIRKPRIAQSAYQAGATSSYAITSPFVNAAYPNTEFYGAKLWFDRPVGSATNIGYLTFYVDYYLEFKGVR